MSTRRRPHGRRGAGGGRTDVGTERWTVSYMDMVTVVMCLFIVLFAISSVDQQKYQALKESLQAGFGNVPDAVVVETVEHPAEGEPEELRLLELATRELRDLTELRDRMETDLERKGLSDTVRFEIDERGLTVRLVSADTFFASGSAELTDEALEILDVVGPVVAGTDYEIAVEGHADYRATVGTPFPTNWELSSARATAVLRHLVEEHDVLDRSISAVGFGSARPIAEGRSAAALAANRRVDIMVLSGQPEAVRAMIPDVLAGHGVDQAMGAAGTATGTTR